MARKVIVALICATSILLLGSLSSRTYHRSGTAKGVGWARDFSKQTYNATLGFGEIMYISMDHRTDRQDAMILVSNFMNISMQRVSGVKGDSIHPVVIPEETKLTDGILGCWRSHVDCWRKTIEDGVDTALVLEDDADWDVSLKDQLNLLSREIKSNESPLRQGGSSSQSARPDAPYGLDWDILHIGHCLHGNPDNVVPGIIYKDPSTVPRTQLEEDTQKDLLVHKIQEDGYRSIARAYRKLESLRVAPPLIAMWRTGGPQDSDTSDHGHNGSNFNHQGWSKFGERSAHKTLGEWLSASNS
ncbi:MAG: hypothetical protein M1840_002287 [Geoglossum simile]|nr:MAG: hypothetical protein M1840_002287 [Geoglossum simile]